MHLKRVLAVFEIVGDRRAFSRKFLRFSHRHEPGPKVVRERGCEDESSRFNADNRVDLLTLKLFGECVDSMAKTLGMLEEGGDVIKINAGLWKIRHLTDELFKVIHIWFGLWFLVLGLGSWSLIYQRPKTKNQRP